MKRRLEETPGRDARVVPPDARSRSGTVPASPRVVADADHERVRDLLAPLGMGDPTIVVIEGEPRSKARPRFTRSGRPYSDKAQVDNERYLANSFRDALNTPFEGNVAVACLFYRSSRHRVDVDNLLKQIGDAATRSGVCWRDDAQVTAILGVLELDRDNPRTVVGLAEHQSSLDRGDQTQLSDCARCGKAFAWVPAPSHAPRRFCSRSCSSRSVGTDLSALASCLVCGKDFKRKMAGQKLCSKACRLMALSDRPARPKGICRICGTTTSRPEYRRCRRCWKAA
jgi:Holliday junction resolvase RusA-like endonuclease